MPISLGVLTAAVLGTAAGTAVAAEAAQANAGGAFVRVEGRHFRIGARVFRFAGANLAVMHHPANRRGADELMAEAARDGVRVARVWAFGEGTTEAQPWQRDHFLFRAGPDGWIDGATDHLDRVIAAAGRAGIRLVVTLANHWADYGGVPQYLRWSPAGSGRRGADGGPARYGAQDRFYGDRHARAAFRAHVDRLVRRINKVTGVPYRDDPTIMAWELMNESQVATAAGTAARRAWIAEMAALIRRADPNHLVSAGVSLYRRERERREWSAVCALPSIDYCDGHLYPEQTLADGGARAIERAVDDFVEMAQHRVGKPFVLGEFGIAGDASGIWQGEPRAIWIRRVFERLAYDGAAGGLLWIYQPAGTAGGGHAVVLGDPGSSDIRAALRASAAALEAAPIEGANPALGRAPADGGSALSSLHAEVLGSRPVIPFLEVAASGPWRGRVSWEPKAFERAFWEATGVWAGGAREHVWGTETGWFEYTFETPAGLGGSPAGPGRGRPHRGPATVVVRARVSSEFPGTLSPADGQSALLVSVDGVALGTVTAPRDDGRGRPVALRSAAPSLVAAVLAPGRHRLRFTVADGPRANGLCLYGRPGALAGAAAGDADAAFIELVVEARQAAEEPAAAVRGRGARSSADRR